MRVLPRQVSSFNLDSDLFDALDRIAKREGESRSEIANRILRAGLHARRTREVVEASAKAGTSVALLCFVYVSANIHILLA